MLVLVFTTPFIVLAIVEDIETVVITALIIIFLYLFIGVAVKLITD